MLQAEVAGVASSILEIEVISRVVLPLPLIHEGQLSVTGESKSAQGTG